MAQVKMKKVLVKVLREGEIKWTHFSAIPAELYERFFTDAGIEAADLNDYLSKWYFNDFNKILKMYKYSDIIKLKADINRKFETKYSELYGYAGMPEIRGWVRMWLSQHMELELEMLRYGKDKE